MDLKKILIIIIAVLVIAELYILSSSEPETNSPLQLPVSEKPKIAIEPAVGTTTQTVSYPHMFSQEIIDQSWANATEVQIAGTANKLSTKYSSYFNKISTACKSTICKVEVTTDSSNQPFPIMVADFVYAMKGQGWLADISVLTEEATGDTTSGKAVIYLINPTR